MTERRQLISGTAADHAAAKPPIVRHHKPTEEFITVQVRLCLELTLPSKVNRQ